MNIIKCNRQLVGFFIPGENTLCLKSLNPKNTFIVYSNSIDEQELFAVYYFLKYYDNKRIVSYVATVTTEHFLYDMEFNVTDKNIDVSEPVLHNFTGIPIVEYLNNKNGVGDFEQQIPLIDAYNKMTSDRINDKEQFLDSLLAIYGTLLGDSDDEVAESSSTMKELGILEMPDGSKAEYLTRTFDEAGMEIIRKALKEDIYTFSHVPCLTDENFVGNSSGVAMEYKLLGLEMITKTKQRYFVKSLKKRYQLVASYYGKLAKNIDVKSIVPVFTRGLPKNLIELANMISILDGIVGKETLLNQLPFVEDVNKEIEAVKQEKDESIKKQKEMFSSTEQNTPPEDDDLNE